MRFARLLAAVGLSATIALTAAPAWAASPGISINTGSGWTHDSTTPLFDFTRIVPGWTGSATLAVRNDTDAAADIGLRATNVVEAENGCNRPESLVDTTCTGNNAGELGKEIVLTVYSDPEHDGTYQSTPTWTGTIEDLRQAAPLTRQLNAGDSVGYRIDAELPYSSGNETQTDQVGFDLVIGLNGTSVAVEGTKITRSRGGVLNEITDRLPFTGAPAMRLAAAGLSLLLAGALLILMVTRRRRVRMY
jgi:hypothetical protein